MGRAATGGGEAGVVGEGLVSGKWTANNSCGQPASSKACLIWSLVRPESRASSMYLRREALSIGNMILQTY